MYPPFSFRKKSQEKHNIASTENSYQFLAPKVPVLRKNKAINSVLLNIHFSAASKTLAHW